MTTTAPTDPEAPKEQQPAPDRPGLLLRTFRWVRDLPRRMYDWVIGWADTPYAVPALFCLSFAESSFFPIPPDVLLIALCIGEVQKSYRFALWCSIASVLGGIAGYGIGMFLWDNVQQFFFDYVPGVEKNFEPVQKAYEEWGLPLVFAAGLGCS